MYTPNNPKWIHAEEVEYATADGKYVNVTAYGESFKLCLVQWSDPWLDRPKSDTLVQNKEGEWLRVWWYDEDVENAH